MRLLTNRPNHRPSATSRRRRRRPLRIESLEVRRLLDASGGEAPFDCAADSACNTFVEPASDWHNPERPEDVNSDGDVSPIDALLVINRINQQGAGQLAGADAHYVDVNDDQVLSAVDVLLVINALNRSDRSTPTSGDPIASESPSAAKESLTHSLITTRSTLDHDASQQLATLDSVGSETALQAAANGSVVMITNPGSGRPIGGGGGTVTTSKSASGPINIGRYESNGSSFDSRAWLISQGMTRYGVFRSGGMIVVIGSDGSDTVSVSNYGGKYVVTFNGKDYSFSESDISSNKLFFFGNRGNDRFTNYEGGRNRLVIHAYGGSGDDTLEGGSYSDILYGEIGNDRLNGHGGNDHLDGGRDADVLEGGAGDDKLLGGSGSDRLNGGSNHDWLDGGEDHDQLFGDSGNDKLLGNSGDDQLYGGSGNDRMFGGIGRDYLQGGGGRDLLQGGNDNDELWGNADSDWLYGEGGYDTIYYQRGLDFASGENRIAVS